MLMIYRSATGRGECEEHAETVAERLGTEVVRIGTEEIRPNPAQPRRVFDPEAIASLAESIRRHGLLQPLLVRRTENGGVELISGERRLRAAAEAGLLSVPCVFAEADGAESAELAIIENLQREDLNMFEEAAAMAALIERYRLTQDEDAERLSVSQACVANKLRLLRHTDEARALILEHHLTERHARALLRLPDAETREEILGQIIGRGLNVAASEALVASVLETSEVKPRRQRIKGAVKDLRLFYNSVEGAIDIARRAGVAVTSERREEGGIIELVIRIGRDQANTR